VLLGNSGQLVRDRDLATGSDPLLFGDKRLSRLRIHVRHAHLLLHRICRKTKRQRATNQIVGEALFVGDLEQVSRDFCRVVSHGRTPSGEERTAMRLSRFTIVGVARS
jgi:hypothetical protein